MTDEVVIAGDAIESPDEAAEQAETPTTPAVSDTTWKARLAGKDRALTEAQKERERLKAENEALARWKAEKEQADLTEVQRLQQRIDALETEKDAALSAAQKLQLEREFPLTFETLGDNAPLDPSALAAIETRLKGLKGESEQEPLVDRNNPRRPSPTVKNPKDKSADDLEADLAAMGNPYRELGFGG